jgi:hypothetical protein
MTIDKTRARQFLVRWDLRGLFIEELGWDHHQAALEIMIDGNPVLLSALAHKRGLVAYHCPVPAGQRLFDYPRRRKIERLVAKSVHEHLIVFTDENKGIQIWQWVKREAGKPAACREHIYHRNQSGDALLQKLESIVFTLGEEERLTLPEVTGRTRSGFDVERVTKRFYDRFQKEHAQFFNFITGITDQADHEWYASVMLNRLMFVYFIQRKGFLDAEPDYLRNRLNRMRAEHGQDQFYSFYRYFLLRLFHEGLGSRTRTSELEKLIGRIPYLDGGIFDVHDLERPERYGKDIHIPDEAFERIFDFFDQYQWHLDERPQRADNEINPDVLGYIFEKYINQKQMGAYYTKEDITGYISKNTVIPFLFDAARAKCKVAFEKSGSAASTENPTVWDLLRTDPDRYIYKAVRHGLTWNYQSNHPNQGEPLEKSYELPEEIAIGLNPSTLHQPVGEVASVNDIETIRLRKNWNKTAPSEYALPTETWRELIARRKRYEEIKAKLVAGEVYEINDLITYNLDISQFAQDVIENCEGPDLLRAVWQALEKISILDPTCGSGAFLFAALNILEPLYEACLCRMEAFVEDLERSGEKHRPEKFSDFRKLLTRAAAHPNRPYFIFKSIILNNLYGLDIMEEAVEICKLRLFLKLAAQVDPDPTKPNLGIEPLPDIDFNIRAGNTLVGYARYEDVLKSAEGDWVRQAEIEKVKVAAADLQQTFDAFRARQVEGDGSVPHEDKQELRKRLAALNEELNRYLAGEYGINQEIIPNRKKYQDAYSSWLKAHQPFHWFVEFYGIIQDRGGFDVIIGNPPYVVNTPDKVAYEIKPTAFITYTCKNLYVFVYERSFHLSHKTSAIGLIVQLSVLSSEKLQPLQDLLIQRGTLIAPSFPRRPESIFDGVEMPVTILLSRTQELGILTSRVSRFYTEERPFALSLMCLANHEKRIHGHRIGKLGTALEERIASKFESSPINLEEIITRSSEYILYYQEACRYWVKACKGYPFFRRNGDPMIPPHGRTIHFQTNPACAFTVCLVNTSLFYWFYSGFSDCEHINDALIRTLKIPNSWNRTDWSSLEDILSLSLKEHSCRKTINTKQGHKIEYDELDASLSKPIIDEIDCVLARHYGFTEEELDFIINYDIKYRMGRENEKGCE